MPSDVLITPASSKIDFTDGANSTKRLNISGTAFSFNSNLNVLSSTSLGSAFKAEGVNGTLFEVIDDLSNSLMSVNTIGGLPVFEVFANNSIIAGQYGVNDFVISGNKVGIGLANPINKLSVSGAVSIGSSYNVAAPSNGLIVQGDVGIGVTSFNYSSANRANLEMYGATDSLIALRSSSGNSYIQKYINDLYINNVTNGALAFFNNGSERWRITSAGVLQSNADQTIQTSTGVLTLATAAGNGNIILSPHGTGNVGIGTASPLTKLDVRSGSITAGTNTSTAGTTIIAGYYTAGALTVLGTEQSSGGPVLGYAVTPSTSGTGAFLSATSIAIPRSAYTQDGGTHRWYIGASQTVAIGSAVTASEVMRINSSGNLGVGTSNPINKFAVISSNTTGYYNRTDPVAIFQGVSPSTVLISVDGNVNGYYAELKLGNAQSTYYPYSAYIRGIQGSGIDYYRLEFGTANGSAAATRMIIANDGNIGVGTTTVSYKLHVQGDIYARSAVINISGDLNALRGNVTTMGYNLTNSPSGAGWITVNTSQNFLSSGDILSQLAYDNYNQQKLFTRHSSNYGATWSAWKTIINSDALSGTTNYVPKFTGTNSIGNSLIFDNGTNVAVGSNAVAYGRLQISATGTSPSLSSTNPTDVSLIISNSDIAYGTMFATYGDGKGALQQRRTNTATYYDFSLQPHGGNVGIGTASAAAKLEVYGVVRITESASGSILQMQAGTSALDFASTFYGGAYRPFTFTNGGSERLRIQSDGNVGIGTTNPTNRLHVYSSNNELVFIRGTTAGAWVNIQSSTSNLWSIGADGVNGFSVYNRTSNGYALIVTNGGNLGIGNITTASNKLHVNGSTSIGSNYNTAAPTNGLIVEGNVGIGMTTTNYKLNVSTSSQQGFTLITNASTVGGPQIDIYDATRAEETVISSTDGTTVGSYIASYLNHPLLFGAYASVSPTAKMVVATSGNVGIGVINPLAQLHINETTSGAAALRVDGTNGTLFSVIDDLSDSLMSVNNSAGLPVLEVFADDRVVMGQYGANDLVVRNNKVGVGTINPQFKLDVNGSLGVNAGTFDGNWPFVVVDSISSGGASRYALNKIGAMGFNYPDSYAQLQLVGANGAYIDFGNAAADDSDARIIYYSNSRFDIQYGTTMTLNSTGVGIGTVNPGTSLEIYATPATSTTLRQMLIINTDFASASGTGFGGSIVFRGRTAGNLLRDNAQITAYNEDIGDNGYALGFFTRPNDALGMVQRMTIARGGNVGIGTNSPGALLNVNGRFMAGGATSDVATAHILMNTTGVAIQYTGNTGNYLMISPGAANTTISLKADARTGAYPPMDFWTSNTSRMTILANGNVGINNTNPVFRLDVNGTSAFRDTVNIGPNIGTITWGSFGGGSGFGMKAESGRPLSLGANGNFDHLVINTSGNVGIGTTNPSSSLHVSKAGNSAGGTILMGVANDNTAKFSYLVSTQYNSSSNAKGFSLIGGYTDASSNVVAIGGSIYEANPATELQFYTHTAVTHATGGTRRMTINTNGNVGIGTVNPLSKLAVDGVTSVGPSSKLSLIGLDINSGATPTYVKIVTTIPVASPSADFTVNIKGFIYGAARNADISISWHYYLSTFYNPIAKSSGGWAPTIRLSAEGGFVAIVLSSPGYWPKFYVESMYSSAYSNQYSTGWSWVDADATGSPIVNVPYASNFGNNFVMLTDGNVGVGTASPAAKLHLSGAGTTELRITSTTANTNSLLSFYESSLASWGIDAGQANGSFFIKDLFNTRTVLTLNSGGNVGIGTTSPSRKLHVYSSNLSDNTVNPLLLIDGKFTAAGVDSNDIVGIAFRVENSAGGSQTSTCIGSSYQGAGNALLLQPVSGNVGVGTINPSFKFEIGAGTSDVVVAKLTQGYERVRYNGFDLLGYNDGNLWMLGNNAANALILGGSWDWDRQIAISYTPATTGAAGGSLEIGQLTKNNANFTHGNTRFYTNGVERLRIISNGYVGIGASSPTYKLQIGTVGSLADSIRIGTYLVAKNTRQYIGYTRDDTGLFESAGDGDTPATVKGGVAGIRIVNTTGTLASAYADNSVQLLTHIFNGGSRVVLHANYDGNVGIGTSVPAALLQIGSGTPTSATGGIQFGGDTSARLYRSSSGVVSVSNSFAAAGGYVYASNYLQTGNNLIYPSSQSATQRLEVGNAANNAWIDGLTIAPGGNVVVAGTLTESSSIRYKENVKTIIAPILPKLNKIRPVTYNKKDNPKHIEYGIIAEELNELFPEFVNKNESGEVESVNYSRLTVILIKAVKELQEEVEKLKNK